MSMSLLMGLILGRFFVYGQICGWKQRSGSGERGAGSGEREAGSWLQSSVDHLPCEIFFQKGVLTRAQNNH